MITRGSKNGTRRRRGRRNKMRMRMRTTILSSTSMRRIRKTSMKMGKIGWGSPVRRGVGPR
eukprot:7148868-Pyramimonas_sp.AAC.1